MQRILAPTDRSSQSEKALPLAAQIASAQDAELILVSVFDEPGVPLAAYGDRAMTPERFEQILEESEQLVRAHLVQLEERLRPMGVRVRSEVRRGPIAASLLDWEVEEQADLLVMTTHGRTRLARFALGSVADRLVREGRSPVLLVRRSESPVDTVESALVMLDGSGVAEQTLPLIQQLAGKPLRAIELFMVVAEPHDRNAGLTYLEGVAGRIAGWGLEVKPVVDIGEPRHDVERAAKDVDIVVLCTHGRNGFDRIRHGSVAEYVVREVDKPTLLVRASP